VVNSADGSALRIEGGGSSNRLIGNNITNLAQPAIEISESSNSNIIENNSIISNSDAIRITYSQYNNITSNTINSTQNFIRLMNNSNFTVISANTFKGSSCRINPDDSEYTLLDQPIANYSIGNSRITVRDTGEGEICFLSAFTISGENFSAEVRIGNNSFFVNSSSQSSLNISANITVFNTDSLGLISRIPFMDGSACPSDICTELSDANTYIFNVTHFTNFSVGEGGCGTLTSSATMDGNLNATATCFTIGANNVNLNCAGYTITYGIGGVSGNGVNNAGFDNVTVRNCIITEGNATGDLKHGISYSNNATNGTIQNNTITAIGSVVVPLLIEDSDYNLIRDNFMNSTNSTSNDGAGIKARTG